MEGRLPKTNHLCHLYDDLAVKYRVRNTNMPEEKEGGKDATKRYC